MKLLKRAKDRIKKWMGEVVFPSPPPLPRLVVDRCHNCGSMWELEVCRGCQKRCCPKHRTGTGLLRDGYYCELQCFVNEKGPFAS